MKRVFAGLITCTACALTWLVMQPSFASEKGVIVLLVMGAAAPTLYIALLRVLKARSTDDG